MNEFQDVLFDVKDEYESLTTCWYFLSCDSAEVQFFLEVGTYFTGG